MARMGLHYTVTGKSGLKVMFPSSLLEKLKNDTYYSPNTHYPYAVIPIGTVLLCIGRMEREGVPVDIFQPVSVNHVHENQAQINEFLRWHGIGQSVICILETYQADMLTERPVTSLL